MSFLALVLAAAAAANAPVPEAQPADTALELLKVRRIYVEDLTGGDSAKQIRDMIISSLQATRAFVLTENPERADAKLRGSAEDLVFTDTYQSSDGISARISGIPIPGKSRSASPSFSIGDNESTRISERKHEAVASIRLVNMAGDIIWSTTQESLGAKFRGSGADVADKVTRKLIEDLAQARKRAAAASQR